MSICSELWRRLRKPVYPSDVRYCERLLFIVVSIIGVPIIILLSFELDSNPLKNLIIATFIFSVAIQILSYSQICYLSCESIGSEISYRIHLIRFLAYIILSFVEMILILVILCISPTPEAEARTNIALKIISFLLSMLRFSMVSLFFGLENTASGRPERTRITISAT
ncbi:MAG: hypothetical protein MHMPM18_002373 [Marteilia pararefringens]